MFLFANYIFAVFWEYVEQISFKVEKAEMARPKKKGTEWANRQTKEQLWWNEPLV